MEWFAKVFIRASLLWFLAGITPGLAMAIHPAWAVYRPAHAHMTWLGSSTTCGAPSTPPSAAGARTSSNRPRVRSRPSD